MRGKLLGLITLVAVFYFGNNARAQMQLVPYYSFSQSSGTYSAISGGTVVASGSSLNGQRYLENLPFAFNFNDSSFSKIYICVAGYIAFGGDPGTGASYAINTSNTGFSAIAGMSRQLTSYNANAEIRYQTLGSSPNRIFVVQWKNLGYPSSTSFDANFQIRLSESTNQINIIYGSVTHNGVLSPLDCQVGLRGRTNSVFNHRETIGSSPSWSSTSNATSNSDYVMIYSNCLPSSGHTYTFNPPVCNVPTNQPTNLSLTPGLTNVSISYTAASPAVDRYIIVRTPGVALNTTPSNGTYYTAGNSLGNGTVVYVGSGTSYNNTGLSQNTYYTYTIFAYNDTCFNSPIYKTDNPLTGTTQTLGPKKYTWVPTSGSSSFQTSTNWSPNRVLAHADDTLAFNNGGNFTVTNIPTQTVEEMIVSGNTAVNLMSSTTNTITLDNRLQFESGSTLSLSNALTLKYSSGSPTKPISLDGTMILGGSSIYDANYTITTVNGIVNDTGSAAEFKTTCSGTCSNIVFASGSAYIHGRDGGTLPVAYYHPASTVNITGIVSAAPAHPSNADFGNYIWNCASQAGAIVTTGSVDTIRGNFTITNTNTYTLRIAPVSSELKVAGNFTQNAGTFLLSTVTRLRVVGNAFLNAGALDIATTSTTGVTFYIHGNIIQGSSHAITKSGSGVPTIYLNGTANQAVSMGGTIAASAINYVLNNLAGATLNNNLTINNGCTNTLIAGAWTGSGQFTYSGTTGLVYNLINTQATSSIEWPATNGPTNLYMNMNGIEPANRLRLHASRSVISFDLTKGVLILGANNLTVNAIPTNFSANEDNSKKMVAADSTGQLIRLINASSSTVVHVYPIGSIKDTAVFSSVYLVMTSNSAARYIGMRTLDAKHPNETATTNYLNRHWVFTDDGGAAACSYYINFNFPDDFIGTKNQRLNRWNGSSWEQINNILQNYIGNPVAFWTFSMQGSLSSSAYPLNGSTFSGRQAIMNTYSWTGAAADMDYRNAANWTPNRTKPDASDILQFNSGNIDTVKNVAQEYIARLLISNNTTVSMQMPVLTTSANYSITGDFDNSNYELSIDSGSALYLNGAIGALELDFTSADTCRARIAGRLEVININVVNSVSFFSTISKVTTSGVIACGTSVNGIPIYSDANSLTIDGIYEHKYTTVGGALPTANWGPASAMIIKGYTTSVTGANSSQTLNDLIYNCPNQTSINNWSGNIPKVNGKLHVVSTGTGSWRFTNSTNAYTATINKYYQAGGNVDVGAGTNAGFNYNIVVSDSFVKAGGTIFCSGAGITKPVLNFAGTTGQQYVSFNDSSPTGKFIYRVTNSNGIKLVGTGALTTNFKINTDGGVRISVPMSYPITTALNLQYAPIGTSLTYDATGNYTADTVVYPATNGPANLAVNLGNNNVLSLPGSRVIPEVLTMTSGNLYIGANNLTIGSSAATPGSIAWTSGSIMTTTGSLKRWYGTTSLPTVPGTGVGFYPIGYGSALRQVSLYFSTTTPLASGGTISVSHAHASGLTTGLSVTDGAFTITNSTNASWVLDTANGIALAGSSVGIRVTAADLFTATSPTNLRVMKASSVVGTHVAGSGTSPNFMAQRGVMSLSDLVTGAFYIGSDGSTMGALHISVKDGDWNDPATWNVNTVPVASSNVFVSAGDTVTSDSSGFAKVITVSSTGALFTVDSTILVDSVVNNNGTVKIAGGKLVMGPQNGGKNPFTNNGSLILNSGILTINGSLNNASGSAFTQTGGSFVIDGANSAIGYVPAATPILYFGSPNITVTGGTMMIVDPAFSTGQTLNFAAGVTADFAPAHTLIFGDGVSTGTSTSSLGFRINSAGGLSIGRFGNIIVNGSPVIGNRRVSQMSDMSIGSITLNNDNAGFSVGGYRLYVRGNITVAANNEFIPEEEIYFSDYVNGAMVPVSVTQTVSGPAASFQTIGSNFRKLGINNTSATGVVMNIGDCSYTVDINFIKGKLNLGNATITKTSTPVAVTNPGQTTGWVVGKFRYNVTSTGAINLTFPVGDSQYYSPVSVTGANAVVGVGSIRVGVTKTDHPNIATSDILSAKSVNRYYSIDTTGPIIFNPNTPNLTFNWNSADIDAGANTTNFTASSYSGSQWIPQTVTARTGTSLQTSVSGNKIAGSFQVGEVNPAPFITLQPLSDTICTGENTSFSVLASNATGYKWQLNTGSGWSNITNGGVYSGADTTTLNITGATVSMSGYQYRCRIFNTTDTSISDPVTLTVNAAAVTPLVSIAPNPNDTICAGTLVTFTATPVNGGNSLSYQWKLNGVNVGSNNTTYVNSGFANNDIVTCVMTTSAACVTTPTATAADTMVVNTLVTPTITISPNPNDTICTGTSVTFTASITNGGSTPSYQWKVNGSNVGSNSNTYTYGSYSNNDIVSCVLTSNATCATPASVSAADTMIVNALQTPSITISPNPNDTICAGTSVTFTATPVNGGSTPSYQWKLNGTNVGTNSTTYTNTSFVNNDIVSCVLTSSVTCPSTPTVTAADTMIVNPVVTPLLTIAPNPNDTICAGTSVTFTATPVNGGSSPSYQWKLNGTNVGTNSSTYTNTGFANGDIVTCTLTSNVSCATAATASAGDTMVVNSLVTPSVSISPNPGSSICSGTSVTFTATPTNGGSAPAYQWKVNGSNVGTNSNTYTSTSLNNGDVVTCVLTSNATCPSPATATSSGITMNVTATVVPSVFISANPGNTICAGTSVTYSATIAGGGSTPSYQWKVNGNNVGTNNNTYTSSSFSNNDVVTCVLTSNAACASPASATSNTDTMKVYPLLTPTITIAASPGTSICSGTTVTFSATITNGGSSPTYQWKVNGVNAGTNSSTFISISIANGDIVSCELNSTAVCANPASVTSNSINMTVNPIVTPSVTVTANPGTSVGPWTKITFTANPVQGGISPTYQWKKNGINIPGAINSSYQATTGVDLANGDMICVLMKSNATCLSIDTTSNCAPVIAVDLDVKNITVLKYMQLFPNPNSGNFTLKGAVPFNEDIRVEVINSIGQTVHKDVITPVHKHVDADIHLTNLASGIYTLRLYNANYREDIRLIIE